MLSTSSDVVNDVDDNALSFIRWAADGRPLVCPRESDQFDFEAELAVIIGKAGRRMHPGRTGRNNLARQHTRRHVEIPHPTSGPHTRCCLAP